MAASEKSPDVRSGPSEHCSFCDWRSVKSDFDVMWLRFLAIAVMVTNCFRCRHSVCHKFEAFSKSKTSEDEGHEGKYRYEKIVSRKWWRWQRISEISERWIVAWWEVASPLWRKKKGWIFENIHNSLTASSPFTDLSTFCFTAVWNEQKKLVLELFRFLLLECPLRDRSEELMLPNFFLLLKLLGIGTNCARRRKVLQAFLVLKIL